MNLNSNQEYKDNSGTEKQENNSKDELLEAFVNELIAKAVETSQKIKKKERKQSNKNKYINTKT